MIRRILMITTALFSALPLMAQEPAATNEFDLNVVSKKYSDAWRQIENRRQERLSAMKTQYVAALENLYQKAISKGDLDGVIAIKAEKDRILTDVSLTDADRSAMAEELKSLRISYDQNSKCMMKERGDQLRQLHGKYVRTLETQEKKLTLQGRVDEALAIRAEKERIMDDLPAEASASPAIPTPAAPAPAAPAPATPIPTVTPTSSYTFYKPGMEPPVEQKNTKKVQLLFTSPQSRAAGMIYTLDVCLITSKEKLQTSKNISAGWYMKSELGTVFHKPRIWITGRNKSIEAGSKLVIEYFSSNIETSSRQEDCVEIIVLPAIPQGKTVVVDAKGIGLYKNESESNYGGNFEIKTRSRV